MLLGSFWYFELLFGDYGCWIVQVEAACFQFDGYFSSIVWFYFMDLILHSSN